VQYVGVAEEKRDKGYKWTTENGRREIERKAKTRAPLRTQHSHQAVVRPSLLSYVTVISELACYLSSFPTTFSASF
jgi:hypothetical protein